MRRQRRQFGDQEGGRSGSHDGLGRAGLVQPAQRVTLGVQAFGHGLEHRARRAQVGGRIVPRAQPQPGQRGVGLVLAQHAQPREHAQLGAHGHAGRIVDARLFIGGAGLEVDQRHLQAGDQDAAMPCPMRPAPITHKGRPSQ